VMKEQGYTYFSIGREAVQVDKEVMHG
jgi:hypothetical protein